MLSSELFACTVVFASRRRYGIQFYFIILWCIRTHIVPRRIVYMCLFLCCRFINMLSRKGLL